MTFQNNLEQISLSLTVILPCSQFLCEGWRLYFCHFNPGKVPFNDLPSEASWLGLLLSHARVSLSPFSIPLSPQQALAHVFGLPLQAHARVLGLLLQIRSWSVPMLPSALESGSRSGPHRQPNLIKISTEAESLGSLILTVCRSRFICDCYRWVFYKSGECIREEGKRITVIHSRVAALILK